MPGSSLPGRLRLLSFPQTHAGSAAILVDKLDARSLERSPNNVKSRTAGLARSRFQLMNGYNPDAGLVREMLLFPGEQTSGCPALCGGNHRPKI